MTRRRIVVAHDPLPSQPPIRGIIEVELLRRARHIPVERVGRAGVSDVDRFDVGVPAGSGSAVAGLVLVNDFEASALGDRWVRLEALLTRGALEAEEELVGRGVVDVKAIVVTGVAVVELEAREGHAELVVLGRGPEVFREVFIRGVRVGSTGVEKPAAVGDNRAIVHQVKACI